MKTQFIYRNTYPHASRDSSIETVLSGFTETLSIDEAIVEIEEFASATPPLLLKARLVTPGLDYTAQAREYTAPAALRKLAREISRTIDLRRASRNRRRNKSKTGAALGVKAGHRG
jgi:hypothetical protein